MTIPNITFQIYNPPPPPPDLGFCLFLHFKWKILKLSNREPSPYYMLVSTSGKCQDGCLSDTLLFVHWFVRLKFKARLGALPKPCHMTRCKPRLVSGGVLSKVRFMLQALALVEKIRTVGLGITALAKCTTLESLLHLCETWWGCEEKSTPYSREACWCDRFVVCAYVCVWGWP